MYFSEQDEMAAEQLAAQVYRRLREGGLQAEPVVELACLVEESGLSGPAVREILERRTTELTPADVARLGRGLLDAMDFEPGFDLEPGRWATLETALKIVERDLYASGIEGALGITIPDWDDSGCARVEFRGACGSPPIRPSSGRDVDLAISDVADAAQDIVMELVWGVWPTCPEHRLGLHAALVEGVAVWQCAGAGTHTAAAIGDLGLGTRQARRDRSKQERA
ncbi:hypothetical protein GCM10023194_18360 [Planotetraspora phitsanulokensis]|uniref:Uncharacterized protein n=1 Tax=Planotetraspora phitsanulokensis TaxID=575192 RepID=A0A8J3XBL8_9ACTN|nr:hypothetical protein [Planotetraspora phitsanulokensis]GII35197.1 hypothetical protein Pph01_02000 [Planotetraspora phitsanulokensis]